MTKTQEADKLVRTATILLDAVNGDNLARIRQSLKKCLGVEPSKEQVETIEQEVVVPMLSDLIYRLESFINLTVQNHSDQLTGILTRALNYQFEQLEKSAHETLSTEISCFKLDAQKLLADLESKVDAVESARKKN